MMVACDGDARTPAYLTLGWFSLRNALVRPGGEDDQGISRVISCGRTNPLAAK